MWTPLLSRKRRTAYERLRHAGALDRRLRRLTPLERKEEARAFLESFARETNVSRQAFDRRWSEVRQSLNKRGTYVHTGEELAFGAKLAWRNNSRCIGRLFWNSLEVRDRRSLNEPAEIFADLCSHADRAYGDGRIRSVISIYAPSQPDRPSAYIESSQFSQYAGYLRPDGTFLGDRRSAEVTRIASSLGWRSPSVPGRFDLLPLLIIDADGTTHRFDIPEGTTREVEISHPSEPAIARLGLRWYSVPIITNMILTIGGIDYPCAPFNGFYMCTEIASRNLSDRMRFNALPDVAQALGLCLDERPPLWIDTALTELNRAVLWSFDSAGVTIVDHHGASSQFIDFLAREGTAGRAVSADWSWIVPPQASSGCEVFHLGMRDLRMVPGFYRSRATDGQSLMPYLGNLQRSRLQHRLDEFRRWVRHRREQA